MGRRQKQPLPVSYATAHLQAICNHVQVAVYHWTLVGQWALFTVIIYLKNTPPKAPPRKVTERLPGGMATEGA